MSETSSLGWQPEPSSPIYHSAQLWDRIVDVLLTPVTAFRQLGRTIDSSPSCSPLPLEAVSIVVLVSALGALSRFSILGGDFGLLIFQVITVSSAGLISWSLASLFFGMVSYAVWGKAPWKRIFILSAFSLLPWMFLMPATVIRLSTGPVGVALGGFLSLVIWVWSALSYSLALKEALQIRSTQLAVLLLLPFCLSLVWTSWCLGFVTNLIQFFS